MFCLQRENERASQREREREQKSARKRGIAVATCNKLTAPTQLPERVGAGNDDGGGIGTEGGGGY